MKETLIYGVLHRLSDRNTVKWKRSLLHSQ